MEIKDDIINLENEFFKYTFPIYRTLAILELYFGLLVLNSQELKIYKINYGKLLNINNYEENKKVSLKKYFFSLLIFFIFFIWHQL
jgi:hypothetical protein